MSPEVPIATPTAIPSRPITTPTIIPVELHEPVLSDSSLLLSVAKEEIIIIVA